MQRLKWFVVGSGRHDLVPVAIAGVFRPGKTCTCTVNWHWSARSYGPLDVTTTIGGVSPIRMGAFLSCDLNQSDPAGDRPSGRSCIVQSFSKVKMKNTVKYWRFFLRPRFMGDGQGRIRWGLCNGK